MFVLGFLYQSCFLPCLMSSHNFRLFSMEGKLLKQLEHIIDSEFSINLAELKQGSYLMVIENGVQQFSQKIIKSE